MQKDWLKTQAENNPSVTAIEAANISYSYETLDNIVSRTAALLESINMNNRYVPVEAALKPSFVITLFALWRNGLVPVLLRESISDKERKELLSKVDYSYWLSAKEQNSLISKAQKNLSVLDDSEYFYEFDEAVVIFTSGSTGNNKGVILTFDSFTSGFNSIQTFDLYTNKDTFLASLPFNHIGGFSIIVRTLLSGGRLYIPSSLNNSDIVDCINNIEPSYISLVPTQLKRLVDGNIKTNKGLKSIYVGGGPSNPKIIKSAVDKKYPVVKVYGSTETCAMIAVVEMKNSQNDLEAGAKPLDGVKIGIHEFDKKLGYGEIIVDSPSLFKEYLDNPELTNRVKQKKIYYTGDLGFIDENNRLHVLGRKDDIVISGGEKLVPAEVYKYLLGIDSVNDAYVFGVEDEEWGQKLVALVVLAKRNNGTGYISACLEKKLPRFKIPKIIIPVDEIPKTDTGKPDRIRCEKILDEIIG